MATIYVRSTDGSNSDNGSTWALAKATLEGAEAIVGQGDVVYVSQNHAEAPGAYITFAVLGTAASPIALICANDGAEPPTATATSGTCTTNGNNYITLASRWLYVYGLGFVASVGGTSGIGNISAYATGSFPNYSAAKFENCSFEIAGTSSSFTNYSLNIGTVGGRSEHKNCTFKFGNSGQGFYAYGYGRIRGGSLLSGGSTPTTLFPHGAASFNLKAVVSEFDLSNADPAVNIAYSGNPCLVRLQNVKLPTDWTGSLSTPTTHNFSRCTLHNSDSTGTNYRLWIKSGLADIYNETVLVRTGGASNGTAAIAWRFVTSADAHYPLQVMDSDEIVRWNETTGQSVTVSIEILHDSATNLKDDEIWMSVEYLGTAGAPLGSRVDDCKTDFLAAAADQTASNATWTTTGMTNPNRQRLSVSLTPQLKGFIHARVHVAKASYTVYVDPMLTVV